MDPTGCHFQVLVCLRILSPSAFPAFESVRSMPASKLKIKISNRAISLELQYSRNSSPESVVTLIALFTLAFILAFEAFLSFQNSYQESSFLPELFGAVT
jgi:hypothetical protein